VGTGEARNMSGRTIIIPFLKILSLNKVVYSGGKEKSNQNPWE
jgi:hypothetical protein